MNGGYDVADDVSVNDRQSRRCGGHGICLVAAIKPGRQDNRQ
jgi:hypothetical protein